MATDCSVPLRLPFVTRPILSSVSTRTSATSAKFCASSTRFSALSAEESPEIVSVLLRPRLLGCVLNHLHLVSRKR